MLLQNSVHAPTFLGVPLIGLSSDAGRKLLLSLIAAVVLSGAGNVLGVLAQRLPPSGRHSRAGFWVRQAVHLLTAAAFVVVLLSIWFDDPSRLATVLGILSAGLAIALQRVIVSFAAYLILLRGRVFAPGDRVVIGRVRGDVVELGFMQTTVMEMGEAPGEQGDDPSIWVRGRQYTGRLVRVTNDKIFDSPVYNYTREFPYLWEELAIPVKYGADRGLAERLLLEVIRRHTADAIEASVPALAQLKARYPMSATAAVEPRVYMQLTDNWVELSARFIVPLHEARARKDAISRDLIDALERNGLEIASATYEIVGLPPVRMEVRDRSSKA